MSLSLLYLLFKALRARTLFLWTFKSSFFLLFSSLSFSSLFFSHSFNIYETSFCLTVFIIRGHACILAILYIPAETFFRGFLFRTFSFIVSILVFVSRNSLSSLLLGWDGLGISSFVLIIWYQRWNRIDRGMITFLTNRFGDLFLILSIRRFLFFGWTRERSALAGLFPFLIITACLTKRAQIPFRVWLPIAIRAPTPIRALVHSRTLVTAGIFIIIKLHHLHIRTVLFSFGVRTILIAGIISLLEIDLKKIVALSTLSQLGLMFSILGRGLLSLVFFHLLRHALVKSAFFILVGNYLLHNLRTQDKRQFFLSRLWRRYHYSGILLCVFSLRGVTFTRGFVTKEALLLTSSSFCNTAPSVFLFLLGVSFTFIYCYRVITVCLRHGSSLLLKRGSTKRFSRSCLLLLLSIRFAYNLSNNLLFFKPSLRSQERLIPILLLSISLFVWNTSLSLHQSSTSFLGLGSLLSLLSKYFPNLSKRDRNYTDQLNWTLFWWTRIALSSILRVKTKGLYLLLIGLCLLLLLL